MKLSKIVNVIDQGIHCSLLNIVCETQTYLDNNFVGNGYNGLFLSIMFKLWKGLKKDREEKRLGKPKIKSLGNFLCIFIFYFLDEVVKNKESHKQKLEAEDAQYLEKRKERARKIIQYEREELDRRETEVGRSYRC